MKPARKRKCNKGRRIENLRVFLLKGRQEKCFNVNPNKGTNKPLKIYFEKNVFQESIVQTDCGKIYKAVCSKLKLFHKTVTYKKGFKNETGRTHTNTVE